MRSILDQTHLVVCFQQECPANSERAGVKGGCALRRVPDILKCLRRIEERLAALEQSGAEAEGDVT